MPDDAPKCLKCGFTAVRPAAAAPLPGVTPGEWPAKRQTRLSESFWRFLAVAMAFALIWMLWIFYQISPAPLVLKEAFEAAAKAKAKETEKPTGTPSAQGVIAPATRADEPAKSAATVPSSAVQTEPVLEKPVEEKPAAAKTGEAEVVDAVEAWARVWSSRDADAYLAFYARDFKTPGGEPRAEWEKGRRQRIAATKSIAVAVSSFKVDFASENLATVTFRQSYSSDVVNSDLATKTLVMARVDGRWLIQQEKAK